MRSTTAFLALIGATFSSASTETPAVPPSEPPAHEAELRELVESQALRAAFVEPPTPPGNGAPMSKADLAAYHTSVLRYGDRKLEEGDYDSALIAFQQVGRATLLNTHREAALVGMARTYRRSGALVKAVATYERLVQDHGGTIDTPMYLLELGRTLRALGAPKLAIARFYSVLHAVLKVPPGQSDAYLQIARTAQYEIAETHFQMGNFEEAGRFFTRLNLLDLAPADRLRAEFKAAQSRARSGQLDQAVAAYRRFLPRAGDDELGAEARFELATLLHQLDRRDESLEVTLDLLRRQYAVADQNAARWAHWQRRTGNQLANEFYNQGDFGSALAIYTRLADINADPRWRLPVLYQMGLCQERLQQTAAARELYALIRREAAAHPALAEIDRMASWRLGQLEWLDDTGRKLEALQLPAHVSVPAERL